MDLLGEAALQDSPRSMKRALLLLRERAGNQRAQMIKGGEGLGVFAAAWMARRIKNGMRESRAQGQSQRIGGIVNQSRQLINNEQ